MTREEFNKILQDEIEKNRNDLPTLCRQEKTRR